MLPPYLFLLGLCHSSLIFVFTKCGKTTFPPRPEFFNSSTIQSQFPQQFGLDVSWQSDLTAVTVNILTKKESIINFQEHLCKTSTFLFLPSEVQDMITWCEFILCCFCRVGGTYLLTLSHLCVLLMLFYDKRKREKEGNK